MTALDKKLLRDLWGLRGQAIAIALVIASGIATFVMSLSTLDSLLLTQAIFYQDYHLPDVFAALKRAPDSLKTRIQEIPGVELVETRVVASVNLEIEGFTDPVTGSLVSIPDAGEPLLNRLHLRQGRLIEAGHDDEVVISEAFANAHRFSPSDTLRVTIHGRRKALTIVGIALSPEYIYQISPGAIFPDFKRYGILWMGRTPLATAYNLEGAFNDVVLTLSPHTQVKEVIDSLDELLKPYGGLGSYGRENQLSYRYLKEEFHQLRQMATMFPVIFLGVAAFLLNVVTTRLVSTQREQIAALKAFGYSQLAIAIHYLKLVILIVVVGAILGIAGGIWLGQGLSHLYMEFYRFPFLRYELQPPVILSAMAISIGAAMVGTLFAVRQAALLPPAQAMRPEPPARYRETVLERLGLKPYLSQPTRMIARHIERKPLKSLLTILGIAFACAIMTISNFQQDAIDFMMEVQFNLAQREDAMVTLVEPSSYTVLYALRSLPGVQFGEVFRSVPVRLRFEQRSYLTSIQGVTVNSELQRLLDTQQRVVTIPPEGIVLTDYLGKLLGIQISQLLTVEVLEGSRPIRQIPVVGFINQYVGVSGYMDLPALNRFMREGEVVSGVYLTLDTQQQENVYAALKEMPRVAGVVVKKNAIQSFYDTVGESILMFTFINTLLAGTIAFGVVYNSARIALSERSRELASLRVLGFTRAEISYILLGELGVLTLLAIPLGCIIGYGLCDYLASNMVSDLYRVPLVLKPRSYAFAATVVLVAATLSSLVVRRQLDHLDLVAVLKTKE
jgi:putative ABC transport system permease protein